MLAHDQAEHGRATHNSGEIENLSLGIVGSFAGKQDKSYPARRYYQEVTKRFSTPMARRTDVSRIQLGYRLVVSVGGAGGTTELVLCPYSSLGNPDQVTPLFPTEPLSVTLMAPAATVYDVVQSGVLSIADEDAFEASGGTTVPLVQQKDMAYLDRRPRQRFFIEPRPGEVKLQIDVSFEFDEAAPGHPFIGHAHVEIKSLDAEAHPHGFIAHVEVHETVSAALDNGTRDEVQIELADTMTLHFAPSFLVAGAEYFADRAAGFDAMDETFQAVNEKYVRGKVAFGPVIPMEQVSRQARVESFAIGFAQEELRTAPEMTRRMLERLQDRTPEAVATPNRPKVALEPQP